MANNNPPLHEFPFPGPDRNLVKYMEDLEESIFQESLRERRADIFFEYVVDTN